MPLRYLVHPGFVVAVLFIGQFLFWFFFMPEVPTLKGAAPRYDSLPALLRWALLFLFLEAGIFIGLWVSPSSKVWRKPVIPIQRIRFWWGWGLGILALALVGEAVYVRLLVQNPGILETALAEGTFAIVGENVRAQRIVGISSLNNLFLLATAILASLSFHPSVPRAWALRARRWLVGLGLVVLIHSLLLAARMFFVYYTLVAAACYIVFQTLSNRDRKISFKLIFLSFVGLVVVVWFGELLRGGFAFAKENNLSLSSPEVQAHIWDRLVQGYLAADLNNALVLLDCEPSMQLWSTTMFAGPLGITANYTQCPGWESAYGTVSVFGLWWYDWGWVAFFLAFLVGFAMGFTYQMRKGLLSLRPEGLYYLLVFPGLLSISRINYFFLTIFVVPFAFLIFIHLIWQARLRQKSKGSFKEI